MKGSTRISSFTFHSLLIIQKLDSFGLRPQNDVKIPLAPKLGKYAQPTVLCRLYPLAIRICSLRSFPSVRKSASWICSTLAGCRLRATLCRLHPLAIRICSLRSLHPLSQNNSPNCFVRQSANPLHLHFFFKSKQ